VRLWYGPSQVLHERRRTAGVLQAARAGDPRAVPDLIALLGDPERNAVRRASAARLLAPWSADGPVAAALVRAARDAEPEVRGGALSSLGMSDRPEPPGREALLRGVGDPARLVRLEAAFGLRGIDLDRLAPATRRAVEGAFAEWLAAQAVLADRPEPHYNRGLFLTARGQRLEAEEAFRVAVARWAGFLPARHELALREASRGRDGEAEREWQAILVREPGWAPARFSLGLLYGRQGRWAEAAAALGRVVADAGSYPRAQYNLGLAYAQLGEVDKARAALEQAVEDSPSQRDALRELVRLAHARGDEAGLQRWLPRRRSRPIRGCATTRGSGRCGRRRRSPARDGGSHGGP
jgi:tetratricopeptide (TPR) repeat protein